MAHNRPRIAVYGPFLAALVYCVAGCSTAPPPVWTRAEGLPVDQSQFQVDRTVCQGQMQQANMAGTVIDTGNPFIDGVAAAKRDIGADDVMKGCMAQHGYLLTAGKP